MDRVNVINYKENEIVFIDLAHAKKEAVEAINKYLRNVSSQYAPNSALILVDVTDVSFSINTAEDWKITLERAEPFIKAIAFLGVTGLRKIIFRRARKSIDINLEIFAGIEKAKDWLIEQ